MVGLSRSRSHFFGHRLSLLPPAPVVQAIIDKTQFNRVNMLRFLSKRFRRRDGAQPLKDRKETEQQQLQKSKHSLYCKILLLDGTDLSLFMRKKALGEELFSRACDHIGLQTESDYFGLQYTDTNSQSHWLDNTKEIRKQVNIGPPYTFRFKVKFYCCDPNTLRDEFCRYLFFLQVSADIRWPLCSERFSPINIFQIRHS